jgi:hypothetical protein
MPLGSQAARPHEATDRTFDAGGLTVKQADWHSSNGTISSM